MQRWRVCTTVHHRSKLSLLKGGCEIEAGPAPMLPADDRAWPVVVGGCDDQPVAFALALSNRGRARDRGAAAATGGSVKGIEPWRTVARRFPAAGLGSGHPARQRYGCDAAARRACSTRSRQRWRSAATFRPQRPAPFLQHAASSRCSSRPPTQLARPIACRERCGGLLPSIGETRVKQKRSSFCTFP